MSTERDRMHAEMLAAQARLATKEAERSQRDIVEFNGRYMREIRGTIQSAAAAGKSECYVEGFINLAKLRAGAGELEKMGYATRECHSGDCDTCCCCSQHIMSVSWK